MLHRRLLQGTRAVAQGKFIAYYRVSTRRQGRSGLGLEAQREAVQQHLNGGRWQLVDEIVEVESGKSEDRPQLAKALNLVLPPIVKHRG